MTFSAFDTTDIDSRICVLDLQSGAACLGPAQLHAGIEALSTALRDPDIHVVILGGGVNAFALELEARQRGEPASIDALHDWLLALHDSEKPVIAAIEGAAQGAGLGLALACDLIVAAHSVQFVLPAADLDPATSAAALWLAARKLPPPVLAAWALRGGALGASPAAQFGLVCELCETGLAQIRAQELARQLARRATPASAALKRRLAATQDLALQQALADERARWLRGPAAPAPR